MNIDIIWGPCLKAKAGLQLKIQIWATAIRLGQAGWPGWVWGEPGHGVPPAVAFRHGVAAVLAKVASAAGDYAHHPTHQGAAAENTSIAELIVL